MRASSLSLWEASGKQWDPWSIMSPQCCEDQSAQHDQRHRLESNAESQNSSANEPSGLLRSDNKRPDGVTLIPWKQGKRLTCDVTMPDTFAQSHLPTTATNVGHAADKSAVSKTQKYQSILQTHLFTPIAIETAGVWNNQAREFITELEKRITTVTGEIKETSYIFQQVSVAI